MDQSSKVVIDNFDSPLFSYYQRNNTNNFLNPFNFPDELDDTNMNIQNGSPPQLIPSPLNSNNFFFSPPSNNSPFLSKKIKRDENSRNIHQTDGLERVSEINEEEEGSDNKFLKGDSDRKPLKLNLEIETKPFTVDKIKYPTKKEIEEIKKCFSDAYTYFKVLKKFLETPWRNILPKYNLYFNLEIQNKFFGTCPKDYIEEILNEKKSQKEKELIPFSPQELKYIFKSEKGGNNLDLICNDNQPFDLNIFQSNNISSFSEDLNIDEERNKNNLFRLDEIKDENTIKIETEIINRIDNLFDRLKTMVNNFFIDIFNTKVEKENRLPDEINNYITTIKGKEDNIKFLENNFKDNIAYFGKDSAQYHDIQTIIERIYQNKTQNEEAIDLLEMPMQIFINEIMGNEDIRQKFFDEDREMKIKEVKNDKCRIIANSLKDKKSLKGQIKLNGEKNYIAIKDANEFIIIINKIKGYENYGLCFTNSENEKIEERTLILENLGDNPMLYLKLINGRSPRNSEKKEKKSGKKNMFSVKK